MMNADWLVAMHCDDLLHEADQARLVRMLRAQRPKRGFSTPLLLHKALLR